MKRRSTRSTPKQYFYHITPADSHLRDHCNTLVTMRVGKSVILAPRDPGVEGEPKIERICVSPTVLGCLAAIPYWRERHMILRTTQPVSAVYPRKVCDSRLTGEKWLLTPTEFTCIGFLSANFMDRLPNANYRGSKRHLKKQMEERRGIRQSLKEAKIGTKRCDITIGQYKNVTLY